MTLLSVWKVLEEIVTEFRKKEIDIPHKVMDDLRSAKVMINVNEADDKSCLNTDLRIEEYLENVEIYLISEAQKSFPAEIIDRWLRHMETARYTLNDSGDKVKPHFMSGFPRNQRWIRVKPLDNLPTEKLKNLATESDLAFRVEEEGELLIYGDNDKMKEFIKRMTIQAKSK